MKVYFSCSSSEIGKYKDVYQEIEEAIRLRGHSIVSDWLEKVVAKIREGKETSKGVEPNKLRKEAISSIENSDILIAEVSLPSSSVGYQIAYALSLKRPVLCLYSTEFGEMKPPQVINANDSSLLYIKSYQRANLKETIKKFFENVPQSRLIKFNFIISPEIENYLDWVTNIKRQSKSDYLRERVVKNIIQEDKEYLNYVKSTS